MKILGLDIGTTTISAVVTEDGNVLSAVTMKNGSFIQTKNTWEKIQDVSYIRETALRAVHTLLAKHPEVSRIGVTGQMHGIVYLDNRGIPVSQLYTWQDGRGDLPCAEGETYVSRLSRLTGYSLSTGYGVVTHYFNQKNDLVPESASVFCTIHDYIVMILAGRTVPVTDASDAASFGLFDVERGVFDQSALTQAGIDIEMLPEVVRDPFVGYFDGRTPVFAAIGDNQASFLGATGGNLDCTLVNIGTGSQISVYTREFMNCPGLETRPFPGGGYLLVGASLCGGRAYALLEQFIRDTVEAVMGMAPDNCYDAMTKMLDEAERPVNLPIVIPLFQGTRQDPAVRASILELSTENFTPRHLIWAMLDGMAKEFCCVLSQADDQPGLYAITTTE